MINLNISKLCSKVNSVGTVSTKCEGEDVDGSRRMTEGRILFGFSDCKEGSLCKIHGVV